LLGKEMEGANQIAKIYIITQWWQCHQEENLKKAAMSFLTA